MHRTKEIRTDFPHMNFPHGSTAQDFPHIYTSARNERTDFSHGIFRTHFEFFLTIFKYVLPIVSIHTILFKFMKLYVIKKLCGKSVRCVLSYCPNFYFKSNLKKSSCRLSRRPSSITIRMGFFANRRFNPFLPKGTYMYRNFKNPYLHKFTSIFQK
jgi:hypothetical protein